MLILNKGNSIYLQIQNFTCVAFGKISSSSIFFERHGLVQCYCDDSYSTPAPHPRSLFRSQRIPVTLTMECYDLFQRKGTEGVSIVCANTTGITDGHCANTHIAAFYPQLYKAVCVISLKYFHRCSQISSSQQEENQSISYSTCETSSWEKKGPKPCHSISMTKFNLLLFLPFISRFHQHLLPFLLHLLFAHQEGIFQVLQGVVQVWVGLDGPTVVGHPGCMHCKHNRYYFLARKKQWMIQ